MQQQEQSDIKELSATQPEFARALIRQCRTVDQAHVLLHCLDLLRSAKATHLAVTASRGRGKSAALGLAIAGALALGFPAIAVTAPHPAAVRTLFEFVGRGLTALGFREHADYEME